MSASPISIPSMGKWFPPLELPPEGSDPVWWPANAGQQAFLNSRAELLMGGGASGGGKLMDVDELIPTPSGFKRNGDLQDGDLVFGEDGHSYEILKAHPAQVAEGYRVSFDDGSSTVVHGGHLWHTFTFSDRQKMRRRSPEARAQRRANRVRRGLGLSPRTVIMNQERARGYVSQPVLGSVKTTEEIRSTLSVENCERANHSIPLTMPVRIQEQILPIDPYVLGLWLGDGSSADGGITISTFDAPELITRIEAAGYKVSPGRGLDDVRYGILGLFNPLRRMRLLNHKAIPEQYLWSSVAQRIALLQGLMDSDGCANKDGQCEFCNTKENLSRGVYHLAASLGMKPTFSTGRAKLYGRDCGEKYTVKWTSTFPAFRLARKLARVPSKVRATQSWRYIVGVEPVGPRAMRCLTTANPTGLYLFGANFNITHNTQVLAADAVQEYKNPRLRALLIRRSFQEMQELEDIQQKMYEPRPYCGRWVSRFKHWLFPSGATIRPGYLAKDKDLDRYQGNPYSYLGIDETGQHPEHRIKFMIGWLTAPIDSGLFVRGRFTSNPGGIGHGWQMKVFLRNRCPIHSPATYADDRPYETSVYPGRIYRGACWTDDSPVCKTTSFIPFFLADNPFYGREKLTGLMSQSKALQQQLLYGCWCNAAGLYFDFMRPDDVVPYASIGDSWWWQHYMAIDYGYGNSAAAGGLYAVAPNGRVFKTRERIERKMPAKKFALNICKNGFDATDYPFQKPQTNWLKKLKTRDPEPPRMSFCVMDEAMDQHRGTGQSIYDVMSDVFSAHGVASMKAAHDPEGNAQVLYNGLSSNALTLTRDSSDLPLTYRAISSRIVDDRKAIKKIHGAWEDDSYDETSYAWNTWRQNSEMPARTALQQEIEEKRKEGVDETTLARIAWNREQAILADERKKGKGIRLGRNLNTPGKR